MGGNMISEDGKVLLGTVEMSEAKRLKDELLEKNIKIELKFNESTCRKGKGCTTTVELWGNETDIQEIRQFFQSERMKLYDGLEFNPEIANQAFDTAKDTAVCPACGTAFPTTSKECPDCGLVFAIPETETSDGTSGSDT